MSAQLISILALVVIFALATTLSVNMGALAFAGAFLVGTLAGGLDADGIFAGFPGDIFVVLVGVTPTCSPSPGPTAPPTGWWPPRSGSSAAGSRSSRG